MNESVGADKREAGGGPLRAGRVGRKRQPSRLLRCKVGDADHSGRAVARSIRNRFRIGRPRDVVDGRFLAEDRGFPLPVRADHVDRKVARRFGRHRDVRDPLSVGRPLRLRVGVTSGVRQLLRRRSVEVRHVDIARRQTVSDPERDSRDRRVACRPGETSRDSDPVFAGRATPRERSFHIGDIQHRIHGIAAARADRRPGVNPSPSIGCA